MRAHDLSKIGTLFVTVLRIRTMMVYFRWKNGSITVLGIAAPGNIYRLIFEAELDIDAYFEMVEGDLAIDDFVMSPGCM